jgi:hypothetical protein
MLTTTHLIGFGAAIATRRTGSSLLDRTAGTNFGNYTADGGLGACFDGTTIQNNGGAAFGSATPPYVGKNWGSALYCYDTAIFYPAADRGFCDGSPTSIDLNLRVKASAPANSADGTLLGTFHLTANQTTPVTVTSNNTGTKFQYVWVEIVHNGSNPGWCAELQLNGWTT